MSYQPSEATKNLQKLLETVEQKQSDYDRLKAAVLSAEVENDRKIEGLNKDAGAHKLAIEAERAAANAEFDKRLLAVEEGHRLALNQLAVAFDMKADSRNKAKIALAQTRTQLRAELAKAGALAEEK